MSEQFLECCGFGVALVVPFWDVRLLQRQRSQFDSGVPSFRKGHTHIKDYQSDAGAVALQMRPDFRVSNNFVN